MISSRPGPRAQPSGSFYPAASPRPTAKGKGPRTRPSCSPSGLSCRFVLRLGRLHRPQGRGRRDGGRAPLLPTPALCPAFAVPVLGQVEGLRLLSLVDPTLLLETPGTAR